MEGKSLNMEEGGNQKFLLDNYQRYDEENNVSVQHENSDVYDQSFDRHLANLGNNLVLGDLSAVEEKPKNDMDNRNEQEEAAEQKPARGRGNRGGATANDEPERERTGRGTRNPVLEQKQSHDSYDQVEKREQIILPDHLDKEDEKQEQKQEQKQEESSNWGDDNPGEQKQAQQPVSNPQGRTGRGSNQENEKKQQDQDDSVWVDDDKNEQKAEEQQTAGGRGRNTRGNAAKQEEEENQLQPDKLDKSDWNDDSKQQQVKTSQPVPNQRQGRGNRGGNRTEQNEEENNGFGNPRRGNRESNGFGNDFNARSYGNNFNRQDRGQGRGGFRGRGRGGFRGNRDENGGQFRNNRYDNEGGNNFRNNNFDNDRNSNRREGGYNRGFNNNNGQQSHRGNFGNRDFNNNQQPSTNPTINQSNQPSGTSSSLKSSSPLYDAVPIIQPKGLESWPEISLYVKKCKVSLTLRSINQHQADALVFPIEDMNFKLHPSVLINADEKYNYRAKIKEKFDSDHWTKCLVYRKPCHGMGRFKNVIFCKVDTTREEDFKQIIPTLFMYSNIEPQCQSLVFPLCKQLKNFKELLTTTIECLISLSDKKKCYLKRIQFSTKDTEWFKECSSIFLNRISDDINENKIYIS